MRLLIVLSIFLTACSVGRLERIGVYREAIPAEYLQYIRDSAVNIIDVRTKGEYKKTHISGAVNASYFSGHFSKLVDSLKINPELTTLIYCETQHRSLFAAKVLYKAGFNTIIDLDKGMINWRKQGFPYVDDSLNE